MSLTLLLDGLIAILLAVTIGYAAVLNVRLKKLRDAQSEFSALIDGFNESTATAEAVLSQIKSVAISGNGSLNRQQLNQQLTKGQGLSDDLNFLVQRGEALADRLAESMSAARQENAEDRSKPEPQAQSIRDPRMVRVAKVAPATKMLVGTGIVPVMSNGGGRPGQSRAELGLLETLKAAR